MASGASHPNVPGSHADHVQLQDGSITWTYSSDKTAGQATVDQVLFTIESSSSPSIKSGKYTICCLKEDLENPSHPHPFELLLLTTNHLPESLRQQRPLIPGLPPHLQSTPENAVDVIVSTKSGVGRAERFWQDVLHPLLRAASSNTTADYSCNLTVTQHARSVQGYAKTLGASDISRTIILVSGDGGVVDLLNGRGAPLSTGPAALPLIALLPLGTGNALFHSLHKTLESTPGPTSLVLGLRTLFLGVAANLPVFKASFTPGSQVVSYASPDTAAATTQEDVTALQRQDRAVPSLYGAIVASYALHASIVYESDTPEYRVHGSARFGMVAEQLLQGSHRYKATLDAKRPGCAAFERDPRDTHGYVLVSMVSNLEKTFTISPDTRPLDGKLHLVQFGPVGGKKVMQAMMAAYDGGKHTALEWEDGERVRYEEVSAVRVVTEEDDARWRKFCVDGTIVDVPRGGGMSVEAVDETVFRVLVDKRARGYN
ncbi:hypothetical protein QQS21_011895 [Conoideocrella luteorostrata]|uniref:DAGKc domain-containing protein n=1 Tax=Conoideocrella luteorostrata TaxID=1105319 RepID=A0AAJ0CEZ2_9HYPO|nr:hypothetical protein QQS21_011895 [Conoideocrella luteorostrata]